MEETFIIECEFLRAQYRYDPDADLAGWFDFDTDELLGTWEDVLDYARDNNMTVSLMEGE